MRRDPSRAAYTLVELLIVVIILGILAAVVIPQFGVTSEAAKTAAVEADLAVLRKAIEIYAIQHNDTYPGTIGGTPSWGNFVTHMTQTTDADGSVGTKYGPYLRTGIPRNPFNNLNTGTVGAIPVDADNATGWWYDPDTGEIRANHSGLVEIDAEVPKVKIFEL